MVKIKYVSSDESYQTEMVCYANAENQIYIMIEVPDGDFYQQQHIVLNKETAIRLAKDLRREISYLQ